MMPGITSLRLVCVLLAVACALAVEAAVREVPADFPTIQGAIDAAAPGDLVSVSPGVYHEALRLTKALTLRASGGPAVTVLDGNSASGREQMVTIRADNVTLEGFTITNPLYSGHGDACGVLIDSGNSGIRVTDCVLHDLGVSDRRPCATGTFGFCIGPVNGLEIDHCRIYSIHNAELGDGSSYGYAMGVFVWGGSPEVTASNVNLHDNEITDVDGAGINGGIVAGGYCAGIAIRGSSISAVNDSGSGVGRLVSTNATAQGPIVIQGNTLVTNTRSTGILVRSPLVEAADNTLDGGGIGLKYYNIVTGDDFDLEASRFSAALSQCVVLQQTTVDVDARRCAFPGCTFGAALNARILDRLDDPALGLVHLPALLAASLEINELAIAWKYDRGRSRQDELTLQAELTLPSGYEESDLSGTVAFSFGVGATVGSETLETGRTRSGDWGYRSNVAAAPPGGPLLSTRQLQVNWKNNGGPHADVKLSAYLQPGVFDDGSGLVNLTLLLPLSEGGLTAVHEDSVTCQVKSHEWQLRRHRQMAAGAMPAGLTGLTALPTAAGAQISYSLTAQAKVTAEVVNAAGRPVRRLLSAVPREGGQNVLLWDARGDGGGRVPAGLYLVRVRVKYSDGAAVAGLVPLRIAR